MKISNLFNKTFLIGLATLTMTSLLLSGLLDLRKRHPLKSVATEVLPEFYLKDSKVLVSAKVLTPEESKQCFGHDLPDRGISPLELTIQNNTAHEYSVSSSAVDLPRIEAKDIAFKITKSSIPRAIAYRLASFFFWPFAIPSTIDGIRTLIHHKNLKKDFIAKSLKDEVVAPYSTYHRVLFVPTDKMQEAFDVTLIDIETLAPNKMEIHSQQPSGT
jgi:hypothetical protein